MKTITSDLLDFLVYGSLYQSKPIARGKMSVGGETVIDANVPPIRCFIAAEPCNTVAARKAILSSRLSRNRPFRAQLDGQQFLLLSAN